jgi:hypothetical protein
MEDRQRVIAKSGSTKSALWGKGMQLPQLRWTSVGKANQLRRGFPPCDEGGDSVQNGLASRLICGEPSFDRRPGRA